MFFTKFLYFEGKFRFDGSGDAKACVAFVLDTVRKIERRLRIDSRREVKPMFEEGFTRYTALDIHGREA